MRYLIAAALLIVSGCRPSNTTPPMPVPDISLAEACVDDLNAQSFSIAFTAERTWIPDIDQVEELEDFTVCVNPSPQGAELEIEERGGRQETWSIDIAFARRLNDTKDQAEIDLLVAAVDEVRLRICPDDDQPIIYSADGYTFFNRGWQFLARFDPTQLNREKFEDDSVGYGGSNFLSIIRFPFLRL